MSNSFAIPWTLARQVPLSMGFFWQEYWNGLLFPSPGYLPDPRIEAMSLMSPALAGRFFTPEPPGKPIMMNTFVQTHKMYTTRSELNCKLPTLGDYDVSVYVHQS